MAAMLFLNGFTSIIIINGGFEMKHLIPVKLLGVILTGLMLVPAAWSQSYAIEGGATNGLKPVLMIEEFGQGSFPEWEASVNFLVESGIGSYSWLQITNVARGKVRLLSVTGNEYLLKGGSARNAFSLPATTTVSNVMQSLAHNRGRGMLWLAGGAQILRTNTMLPPALQGGTYRIGELFGVKTFTNDLLFEVRPLLYQVDANHPSVPVPDRKASLVEFPPIRVKLHTNGTVENALNH
jgi:hypothetical protein